MYVVRVRLLMTSSGPPSPTIRKVTMHRALGQRCYCSQRWLWAVAATAYAYCTGYRFKAGNIGALTGTLKSRNSHMIWLLETTLNLRYINPNPPFKDFFKALAGRRPSKSGRGPAAVEAAPTGSAASNVSGFRVVPLGCTPWFWGLWGLLFKSPDGGSRAIYRLCRGCIGVPLLGVRQKDLRVRPQDPMTAWRCAEPLLSFQVITCGNGEVSNSKKQDHNQVGLLFSNHQGLSSSNFVIRSR